MKRHFYPSLLLFAWFIAGLSQQMTAQQHHLPDREGNEGSEYLDDPHLPNAYGNQRVTPAFHEVRQGTAKTNSTSIFTQQANLNGAGQNIVGDAANEPSMMVNPANENEIVIGWRQFDNIASNFRQGGYSHSTDGGLTWSPISIIEPGIFRSDPVLDIDKNGKFYYNSLTNSPDYFCKTFGSTNGGATWDLGTDAHGGDKQWLAIDRTSGPGAGNIYSNWSETFTTCPPGYFTRSVNGNLSYENCTLTDDSPWRGTLTIDGNGDLYLSGMSFYNLDSVVVTKSTNAKNAGSNIAWTGRYVFMDGALQLGLPINPVGLTGQINIDCDRSGGAADGNVYVVAPMTRFSNGDPCDVMFVRSTDGGSTWSAPIQINDDAVNYFYQWMPTMSVAPNGRIDVAWLDTRDGGGSDNSALYYSYSTDQGMTWSVNEKLSNSFDPHVGYPSQDKMGDYFDMFSTNSGAHLAWAGTLNGEEDVYCSHIVPGVISGVEAAPTGVPFSFFPNPSDGKLVIQTPLLDAKLRVLNALGEEVFATQLQQGNTELDIAALPAGMYFLKVFGADGSVAVKKLIRD